MIAVLLIINFKKKYVINRIFTMQDTTICKCVCVTCQDMQLFLLLSQFCRSGKLRGSIKVFNVDNGIRLDMVYAEAESWDLLQISKRPYPTVIYISDSQSEFHGAK